MVAERAAENILEVADLHVRYGAFEAVKGVSFALRRGGILGIVGESGSGKSTIAKTLMGLHQDYRGDITYPAFGSPGGAAHIPRAEGESRSDALAGVSPRPTARVKPAMQMIFQDAVGSLNPRMTIRQTLAETLALKDRVPVGFFGRLLGRGVADAEIVRLLALVGLSRAVLDQYPRELSGGQCQRVSIARALACRPDILVADEPVSALDVSVQARVLNILRDLRRGMGLSILLIAHDLAVVKNVCDDICVMEHGLFVDRGSAEDVFAHPTSDYTKRLLAVVPRVRK